MLLHNNFTSSLKYEHMFAAIKETMIKYYLFATALQFYDNAYLRRLGQSTA